MIWLSIEVVSIIRKRWKKAFEFEGAQVHRRNNGRYDLFPLITFSIGRKLWLMFSNSVNLNASNPLCKRFPAVCRTCHTWNQPFIIKKVSYINICVCVYIYNTVMNNPQWNFSRSNSCILSGCVLSIRIARARCFLHGICIDTEGKRE